MNHPELAQALLILFDDNLTDCLKWLNGPNKALGDIAPMDKILDDGNVDAVLTLVNQLCHGIIV